MNVHITCLFLFQNKQITKVKKKIIKKEILSLLLFWENKNYCELFYMIQYNIPILFYII